MRPLVHESGHAISLLAAGVPVTRLVACEDGTGVCQPAREPDDIEDRLVSYACGFAAALELSNGQCATSVPDRAAMDRLGARWAASRGIPWTEGVRRSTRELFLTQAKFFVQDHEREIIFLATALGKAGGRLDSADIGRLCREPCSPLRAYSNLYPEPVAVKRTPSAGLTRRVAPKRGRDEWQRVGGWSIR